MAGNARSKRLKMERYHTNHDRYEQPKPPGYLDSNTPEKPFHETKTLNLSP
jgi:hypothetical protein